MIGLRAPEKRPLPVDPIDLVAIDLDGTLLRQDGAICFQAAQAIHTAMELGVRVVLATGRAPRGVRRVYEALGLDTVQICQNGALVHDPHGDQAMFHEPLPGELARRVIEIARGVAPDIAMAVEVYDRCYTDRPNGDLRKQPSIVEGRVPDMVGALGEVLNAPVTKVMACGEPDRLGGIQMALQRQLGVQVAFSCSHLKLLQVVNGNVDKRAALERVCDYYGIEQSRTMAIGDAPNDLGMIQWAGLGVAMKNGWSQVRCGAHFIVGSNDDAGVAEAFKRYVLLGR